MKMSKKRDFIKEAAAEVASFLRDDYYIQVSYQHESPPMLFVKMRSRTKPNFLIIQAYENGYTIMHNFQLVKAVS